MKGSRGHWYWMDSFVVAREVVFKSEAYTSRKLHMHNGRVCIRMRLKSTMGQTSPARMGFHSIACMDCSSVLTKGLM